MIAQGIIPEFDYPLAISIIIACGFVVWTLIKGALLPWLDVKREEFKKNSDLERDLKKAKEESDMENSKCVAQATQSMAIVSKETVKLLEKQDRKLDAIHAAVSIRSDDAGNSSN